MKRAGLLSLTAVVLLPTLASARLIELWPYERLMKEADLVVIAKAGEAENFDGNVTLPQFQDVLIPQVTTFQIDGVLKGEMAEKSLKLVHCKLKDVPVINGPLLAHFETSGRRMRIENENGIKSVVSESQPGYLLFLKRRDDGAYEPVAGQVDSELSVRRVSSAFGF